MNTLKDRIEKICKEMGWRASDIAKHAGLTRAAVAHWLSGKVVAIIDVEVAFRLESATGYSALWIAKGIGPEKADARVAREHWPFPLIDEQKIYALSSESRSRLEAALLLVARDFGLSIERNSSENAPESLPFTVDDLAQEIRRVDGKHSLGAGALAEALMSFLHNSLQARTLPAD